MKQDHNTWIRKAEENLRCAQLLLGANAQLWNVVCLHCGQCAANYLKALLVASDTGHANGQGIDQLLTALGPAFPQLEALGTEALWLAARVVDDPEAENEWNATENEGRHAFDIALNVRRFCRERMEITYAAETAASPFVEFLRTHSSSGQTLKYGSFFGFGQMSYAAVAPSNRMFQGSNA